MKWWWFRTTTPKNELFGVGCGEVGLGACASWLQSAETVWTGQRRWNYETPAGHNRLATAINLLVIQWVDPSADGA